MKKRSKVGTAWAIDLRYSDHVSWPLAGVYCFCKPPDIVPAWSDGCRTALFSTRAVARAHQKAHATRGHVVKVVVTIGESYDDRQIGAVLGLCVRCGEQFYFVARSSVPVCARCR